MATQYINTGPSEPPALHDIYRVTLIAPSHWYMTASDEATNFANGVAQIFAQPDGLGVVPLNNDPVGPGDRAAVIDLLYPSSSPWINVSQIVSNLATAAGGNVEVQSIERIVGTGAATPGTPGAGDAFYGDDATAARDTAQQTVNHQEQAKAAAAVNPFLKLLSNTGDTVIAIAIVGVGIYSWRKSRE